MSSTPPPPDSPPKKVWTPPALTKLGTIRELMRGAGKVGSVMDGDPNSVFKRGTG
jgi:hypothetical protein